MSKKSKKNKKKKKWKRGEIIGLIGFIIIIPAAIFGAIEFYKSNKESLEISKISSPEKYLHVSEITKTRHNNFFVSQVAEWQKLRIGNKSNFPITITDSYLKINGSFFSKTINPYLKKVEYSNNEVRLSNPVSLPITIEPKKVEELNLLLNIPVDTFMGMAFLITSWDSTYAVNESSFLSVIMNKNYFESIEDSINSQMKTTALSEVLHIETTVQLGDAVKMERVLLSEENNEIQFLDNYNNAKDGFIFREKGKCLYELNELLLRNGHPIKNAFESIEICFKTLEGNEFKVKYSWKDFWK